MKQRSSSLKKFVLREKKQLFKSFSKSIFWFFTGIFLGLFLVVSFVYIYFEKRYQNVVYPGITIAGTNFSGQKQKDVEKYFENKNATIRNKSITFQNDDDSVSIKAGDLQAGYNAPLLAQQAIGIGKSSDVITNISIVIQAYFNGIELSPSYFYSEQKLNTLIEPIREKVSVDPVNALFNFKDGKVTAFKPSSDGKSIDDDLLHKDLNSSIPSLFRPTSKPLAISIPVKIIKPTQTTEKVNNLGIKELVSSGTSLFQHSIETRIFNVTLAASRLNGVLVAPGETFSFDKALGDVSAFTGYKQAYVIQDGKTVLGDGGGVCQVSTTLFRAILNAGLPIVERHAHAYRVGYYEEDSPPGLDATVYVPSVDLKFKNDTKNYILIQSSVDPYELRLTFNLYGAKDGRQVSMTKPVVTNQTPAPPDVYQDDPTLPKGVIKQIDFAAAGATATFSRTVTKDGKTIIADTYVSNYQPWQAIYLRGTKD